MSRCTQQPLFQYKLSCRSFSFFPKWSSRHLCCSAADGVGRQRGTPAWDGRSHLLLGAHQRPQLLHGLTQLLSLARLSSSGVSQLSLQLRHLAHKHPDRPLKTGSELTGSSQWRNCAVHHRRGLFSSENFCRQGGRLIKSSLSSLSCQTGKYIQMKLFFFSFMKNKIRNKWSEMKEPKHAACPAQR